MTPLNSLIEQHLKLKQSKFLCDRLNVGGCASDDLSGHSSSGIEGIRTGIQFPDRFLNIISFIIILFISAVCIV